MILQTAIFPNSRVSAPSELYFHASPENLWSHSEEEGISINHARLHNSPQLSFNSFFGAFSLNTWSGLGGIEEITIEIEHRGDALIQVWHNNGYEPISLLASTKVGTTHKTLTSIKIDDLKGKRGIVYPTVIPKGEGEFSVYSIAYRKSPPPEKKIRLAIIMPTFKREKYVLKNMSLLENELLSNENCKAELFIIDNGSTLQTRLENPRIHLVSNRNYGGAGGFARGIIEACQQNRDFTHVLFCDDDVLIEPESIKRLISLLHFIDDQTIIPGGMIDMGNRGRLHEIGANTNGLRFSGNKEGLDLRKAQSVIDYCCPEISTFYGWWFVCYPLSLVKDSLPFPTFVGFDDVEYGKRFSNSARIAPLNGISVWHEEFTKKDVNWRWYYHTRNGLAVHYCYQGGRSVIRHFFRQTMKALLTYRYERAEFMIQGAVDAMKGPEDLVSTRPDERHQELVKKQKQKAIPHDPFFSKKNYFRKLRRSPGTYFLSKLSLNGHLLPNFLIKQNPDPRSTSWAIEPLHSLRTQAIFRRSMAIYTDPSTGQGLLCKLDKKEFFKNYVKLLAVVIKLHFHHSQMKKEWSESKNSLTTPSFWTRYLGLKQGSLKSQ